MREMKFFMKTRYAILQLVQAHYSNNFKKFDDFAKALAEVYAQDGDLQAKDEILKMIANNSELAKSGDNTDNAQIVISNESKKIQCKHCKSAQETNFDIDTTEVPGQMELENFLT